MATVNTGFDPSDEVWTINKNKICKGEIESIEIIVTFDTQHIIYKIKVDGEDRSVKRDEDSVWYTLMDIAKSIEG